MTLPRWTPPITQSSREARIRKRVGKKRKLFGFLCDHRRELFDEDFHRHRLAPNLTELAVGGCGRLWEQTRSTYAARHLAETRRGDFNACQSGGLVC